MDMYNRHHRITRLEELPLLLTQDESSSLEFKSEWYKLKGIAEGTRREKDELVKDILALANGNAESAGETAFMVVGAEDQREPDGTRKTNDVGDSLPTAEQIINIVSAASSPPLASLEILPFSQGDKRLFAVAILPSPHVFETTRELVTPKQRYSKYVVFIRRGNSVDVASERERQAIRRVKQVLLAEARNPPSILFGASVGATIGGVLLARVGSKLTGNKEGTIAGVLVGPIVGGLFGALIGSTYQAITDTQSEWRRVRPASRRLAIAASAPIAVIIWYLSGRLGDALSAKLQPPPTEPTSEPTRDIGSKRVPRNR